MLFVLAGAVHAETLRIATYNPGMKRQGPGLLLRDLQKPDDPTIAAGVQVIVALKADVLLLTGFDYDLDQVALKALSDQLSAAGLTYPYLFSARPNTGMRSGLDLDGDGKLGGPGDAQGYGRFSGEGGMAVLSRLPIRADEARDFSSFLWRDLPGALLFDGMTAQAKDVQRLSTTGHWDVPIDLPGGQVLHLLAWAATPPVFDGVEDRNGRRNHDEAAFWIALLDGKLPMAAPASPFVVLGDANLDTVDGDGIADAMLALISHPMLQKPSPRGRFFPENVDNSGDTADFSAKNGPGGLQVDYVLPSRDLVVTAAGVLWPKAGDPLAAVVATASRHRPVWVDVALP